MDEESIDVIRSGVCIRSFPCSEYSLNLLNGLAVIQHKETRKIVAVLSPTYYDYLEVTSNV